MSKTVEENKLESVKLAFSSLIKGKSRQLPVFLSILKGE